MIVFTFLGHPVYARIVRGLGWPAGWVGLGR